MVLHGVAGTGKTELAKAFARWWQATDGVEDPRYVVFHSFEPGLATPGLDGAVTQVGLTLYGTDFVLKTRDAAHRQAVILDLLRDHRMLLIWDNVESLHDLPEPGAPPLDDAGQAAFHGFLAEVAREGGRSAVILTSRTQEAWLGEVRRVPLGGLSRTEAAAMADDLLASYSAARRQRETRDFERLLEWIDGHPLSLRLMLPHLETVSAAALLDGLRGATAALPPGFVGEGRTAALCASLAYSFDHVPAAMRSCLSALALFEGVADEDVLAAFSRADGVPPRFAGLARETWSATLRHLAGLGVLTPLGDGQYGLHPALPAYLVAAWREDAGAAFAAERDATEAALLDAYAGVGGWLREQIQTGAAEFALALLDRQRRTIGQLLGVALARRQFTRAQALIEPLNTFWDTRGLAEEARGWVDRCRAATEVASGALPDFESEAGRLWLFVTGSEAVRAIMAGDLARAAALYEVIRAKLEGSTSASRDHYLGVTYHQLGMVAQLRGDLDAAEGWYRKSLEIEEALDNRPGMSISYRTLGKLAQAHGDAAAAEAWFRKEAVIRGTPPPYLPTHQEPR